MKKKLVVTLMIGTLIGLLSAQTTLAVNPKWVEDQQEGYKALGVKPGEVYNAENWQGIDKALPFPVRDWVKKGEFVVEIGEMKYDMSPDQWYDDISKANAGKYAIGDRDQTIVKATGEDAVYLQGAPFPDIDVENDPQAGLKVMINYDLGRMRVGSYFCNFDITWISDEGLDRMLYGDDYFYYVWNRPDGKQVPNPQKVKRLGLTYLREPYDLKGAAMLYHYWLDGRPERFVQYIPALRRIKKMNTTDRSSPFFGTDFCNDDGGGWVGQPESMTWKIKEVKYVLIPIATWACEKPTHYKEVPGGGWESTGQNELEWGFLDKFKDEKYNIAWMPWFVKWVPRKFYVLGMYAKDPYYAYGDQELWVDVENNSIAYKIVWDKSDSYWKTLVVNNNPSEWQNGERLSFSSQIFYLNVDDKTHHASVCNANQRRGEYEFKTFLNWYKNKPRLYKDDAITSMGRLN